MLLRKVNHQAKVRRRDGKRVTPPRRFQPASVGARADRSRRAVHRGRGKDEALVIEQHIQPRGEVARVIGAWLELGHDAEIGAEEACAKLGDQFFACARSLQFCVAAETSPGWRDALGARPTQSRVESRRVLSLWTSRKLSKRRDPD